MSEDLASLVAEKLYAAGMPELDYSTFRQDKKLFSRGSRSQLTKGSMPANVSGTMEERKVVLKTINERHTRKVDQEQKNKLIQYFEREAGVWRYSRSHPNILELYGFVRDPGQVLPSLVSPFYELGNARSFMENPPNRALPEAQRIQLTRDIARGLYFRMSALSIGILEPSHSKNPAVHSLSPGIVHRDVRGSNVLVRVSTLGIAGVLIDFGSAKLSDQDMFPVMNSSQPDNDSWSPPEYVLDPKKYTEGTTSGDIWSLACTCYEIITARDPYPKWCDLEDAHANGDLPLRPSGTVNISDALWTVLEQCWSREPQGRPSAQEAIELLEGLIRAK